MQTESYRVIKNALLFLSTNKTLRMLLRIGNHQTIRNQIVEQSSREKNSIKSGQITKEQKL